MNKKNRIRIPQISKIKAKLQQEIDSKCPFCESTDVGHFEIHHIDEAPSNNDEMNLLLVCPTCHSKITKRDIPKEDVVKVKSDLKNKKANIQFIGITIDSENCGWEPYENISNAFKAVKYKSLFPIFNFTFINNSDKAVLLTDITILCKRLPIGLSGPDIPLPNILRPLITYKIKLPSNGESIKTRLVDEIEVPQKRGVKFQVELYSENMNDFKPPHKYALNFQFGFNNDFHVEAPMILLNSEKYYAQLRHYGLA